MQILIYNAIYYCAFVAFYGVVCTLNIYVYVYHVVIWICTLHVLIRMYYIELMKYTRQGRYLRKAEYGKCPILRNFKVGNSLSDDQMLKLLNSKFLFTILYSEIR
jgi:hypothetical protein